ncbi:MAG: VCBS repeat-containing protein [Candidatus Manganitrophus sp.]|nr:VCBS repeat-containing protein [Candidatus Manganitrophus sp.]
MGRAPFTGTVADFNRDRHLDIAIVSRYDRLMILLGKGDGSFENGLVTLIRERSPLESSLGLFNGDAFLDLAIANNGPGSHEFIFFWGRGDGTFEKGEKGTAGMNPLSLISEDFNQDKRPDIVVVNGLGDSLSLFLQEKEGRYGKAHHFGAEGGPVAAVAADFSGDGLLDLVVANSRSSNISFLAGKGDGTFSASPR